MKRLTFSLYPTDKRMKIIGKPINRPPLDTEKSGQDLYDALQDLPFPIGRVLDRETIAGVLCAEYSLEELKQIESVIHVMERTYESRNGVFSPRTMKKSIEQSVTMKETERANELLRKLRKIPVNLA